MTTIEAYNKALREFFGRKTYLITSNCIVFGDLTLRFRSSWLIIDERSYECSNALQLLNALKSEGLKISEYCEEAFPRRISNLLNSGRVQWRRPAEITTEKQRRNEKFREY